MCSSVMNAFTLMPYLCQKLILWNSWMKKIFVSLNGMRILYQTLMIFRFLTV